jgi:molybdate transport system substrate-binding protein
MAFARRPRSGASRSERRENDSEGRFDEIIQFRLRCVRSAGPCAYLDQLFKRLGIAEQLREKTVKPDTESVSEKVAAGEVELGLIVIPNILSVPGAQLVGPIPEEVQSYIVFTAAVAANSTNREAARDLVTFLRSPAAVATIKAKGMIPN